MKTREKVRKVLESTVLARIATVDENGFPKARSVDFVSDKEDESVIYFMSFKAANKVNELQTNNNVYVVADKDADSMEELTQLVYVKGSGKAYMLQTQEEMQKAMGLYFEKYPYLMNMPGDPSMMVWFKIELDKVIVTDNTVSFGHTEEHIYR